MQDGQAQDDSCKGWDETPSLNLLQSLFHILGVLF